MSVAVILCGGKCAELYDPDEWRHATVYVVNEMACHVSPYDYAAFLDHITQQRVFDAIGKPMDPRKGYICINATKVMAEKNDAPGIKTAKGLEWVRLVEDLKPNKHTHWQNWSFTTCLYVAAAIHAHDEIHLFGVDHEGTSDGYKGIPVKPAWNSDRWRREKEHMRATIALFDTLAPCVSIVQHLYKEDRILRQGHKIKGPMKSRTKIKADVKELNLPRRAINALRKKNITTCSDVVRIADGPNGYETLCSIWGINVENVDEIVAKARTLETCNGSD